VGEPGITVGDGVGVGEPGLAVGLPIGLGVGEGVVVPQMLVMLPVSEAEGTLPLLVCAMLFITTVAHGRTASERTVMVKELPGGRSGGKQFRTAPEGSEQ
jgi:hypothetical protein